MANHPLWLWISAAKCMTFCRVHSCYNLFLVASSGDTWQTSVHDSLVMAIDWNIATNTMILGSPCCGLQCGILWANSMLKPTLSYEFAKKRQPYYWKYTWLNYCLHNIQNCWKFAPKFVCASFWVIMVHHFHVTFFSICSAIGTWSGHRTVLRSTLACVRYLSAAWIHQQTVVITCWASYTGWDVSYTCGLSW